jgi:hypothetical protein
MRERISLHSPQIPLNSHKRHGPFATSAPKSHNLRLRTSPLTCSSQVRNNVRSDGAIGRIGPGDRHSAIVEVFLYKCNEGDVLVALTSISGVASMTIDRDPMCLEGACNLITGSKTCRDMPYAKKRP